MNLDWHKSILKVEMLHFTIKIVNFLQNNFANKQTSDTSECELTKEEKFQGECFPFPIRVLKEFRICVEKFSNSSRKFNMLLSN